MKQLIINTGRSLIDIFAFLFLLGIIIFGIVTMVNVGFAQGLSILGIGIILLVYIFYAIYLLVSIHDNLIEINEKLSNKQG